VSWFGSDYPSPRGWSEMSVDFKLMFGFHAGMMILLLAGSLLSTTIELATAAGLLLTAMVISVAHRRAVGWRWRGIGPKEILRAAMICVGALLVLAVAMSLFPPTSPLPLPFYLAGGGVALFNLLKALNLTCPSEAEFRANCGEAAPPVSPPPRPALPLWKRVLLGLNSALGLLLSISFVAFFYLSAKAFIDGLPTPTPTQTAMLSSKGSIRYVSADQKHLIDLLQTITFTTAPILLLLGVFLHFVLKVRVFDRSFGRPPK
jgi:hypothetical protein